MITGIYAALLAFMHVFLTFRVISVRRSENISVGDGGNEELLRRMRMHGNFVETVLVFVLLLLLAELSGSPLWALHGLGILMIAGRLMHFIGFKSAQSPGLYRVLGMVTSINAILFAAVLCLVLGLQALL